jgi:hypothetical protein
MKMEHLVGTGLYKDVGHYDPFVSQNKVKKLKERNPWWH